MSEISLSIIIGMIIMGIINNLISYFTNQHLIKKLEALVKKLRGSK